MNPFPKEDLQEHLDKIKSDKKEAVLKKNREYSRNMDKDRKRNFNKKYYNLFYHREYKKKNKTHIAEYQKDYRNKNLSKIQENRKIWLEKQKQKKTEMKSKEILKQRIDEMGGKTLNLNTYTVLEKLLRKIEDVDISKLEKIVEKL